MKLKHTKEYLLLLEPMTDIKANDYFICSTSMSNDYIVLKATTNTSILIYVNEVAYFKKDGIKIIGYRKLIESAEDLDLPLLPNPFENDGKTLKLAKEYVNEKYELYAFKQSLVNIFLCGYKARSHKQFSLEDVKKAIEMARIMKDDECEEFDTESISGLAETCTYGLKDKYTKEEIIQSLIVQYLPNEFVPEYIYPNECYGQCGICDRSCDMKAFKTIKNSENKQELIGVYK